jgi:hypothetical protein
MDRLSTPFVTTCHGRLDLPGLSQVIKQFPSAPFISISDNQRFPLPRANWLGTVYHGLPSALYQPSFGEGQYLAFLGRITPEKGPKDAIKIAREAGLPLRIAAKVPRQHSRYFQECMKPLIDGAEVQFIGELDEGRKGEFLRNAIALLFPIDWPEPFGLVMIEAMACGTPVIAYPCGSVLEVIDHGITGFIVNSQADAAKASGQVYKLDRAGIRATFEKRFTSPRMAAAYLDHYKALAQGHASRPRTSSPAKTSVGKDVASFVAATDPRGLRLLPKVKGIAVDPGSVAGNNSSGTALQPPRKCVCASATHGHKPGKCRRLASEPDLLCKICRDKVFEDVSPNAGSPDGEQTSWS